MLKVLKSGALIGDIEREWEAGQKVSQLADQGGNLPVRCCRLLWRAVFPWLPLQSALHVGCYYGGGNAAGLALLQGFMKVGPALVRPDGKMVGECLRLDTHHSARLQHTAA